MGLQRAKRWAAVLALSLVVLIPLSFTILFIANYTEEIFALEDAKAFTRILQNVQSFYTKEIIPHAIKNKISVEKHYKNAGAALPFPATFAHEINEKLNSQYKDFKFFLYSAHPFYLKPENPEYEAFHKEALAFLQEPSQQEFYKIVEHSDHQDLRYARAIRMEQECVNCHNSHPDSPVKNWKVGDLRGIQSVSVKLSGFSFWKNGHLNPIIVIVMILYALVSFFLASLLYMLRLLSKERFQRDVIRKKNDELQCAHDKITEFAYYDMVTGLRNRIYFENYIHQLMAEDNPIRQTFSILMLDLDHFKSVNDRYGHAVGDALLKEISGRLKTVLHDFQDKAVAARLSGDEFVVLLLDVSDIHEIDHIAGQILRALNEPITLGLINIRTGASIGVSRFPKDGTSAEELLAQAGLALNEAKSRGRSKHWVFDWRLQTKQIEANRIETDLKLAIDSKSLEIFYQPKICLKSGLIKGFEALVRWPHAELGFIPPDHFLPIAEERGLIIPVTRNICEQVAQDLSQWLSNDKLKGRVAINLHPSQLKSFEEMEKVLKVFSDYNIPLQQLTLEITESCVIGRGTENTSAILYKLIDQGINISLDDFGKGYASLTHLKNLPVDEVKIDRHFIQDILTNHDDEVIVRTIIDFAEKIGLKVVAEGIETKDQLDRLIDLGCTMGQGFVFAPPSTYSVATGFLNVPNLFKEMMPERTVGQKQTGKK